MSRPSAPHADPTPDRRRGTDTRPGARSPRTRATGARGRAGSRLLGRRQECAALHGVLDAARSRRSATVVIRGEAGSGKSALLDHVRASAVEFQVARCCGVESEMELAYAGLHQLCSPLLGRIDQLPDPQRHALEAALGLTGATGRDRFLVGLAVLSLWAVSTDEQPLLCLVDDAQWLDQASLQTLAFVGRRLAAEPIALVFAVREGAGGAELAGLPALSLGGLDREDAHQLLASVVRAPLDEHVRDRIVAEAHGNPLALQELPRGLSPDQLAGGFAMPDVGSLTRHIEQSFLRRVGSLPRDTRLLLLGAPPSSWESALRRPLPPRPPNWSTSAPGSASGTPSCAPRSTTPPSSANGGPSTAPWPRPPIRAPIPTARHGTVPTPPSVPTRTSPPNWSVRPTAPARGPDWPPRRPSTNARPPSPWTPSSARPGA
jgi:hypothetical protein